MCGSHLQVHLGKYLYSILFIAIKQRQLAIPPIKKPQLKHEGVKWAVYPEDEDDISVAST